MPTTQLTLSVRALHNTFTHVIKSSTLLAHVNERLHNQVLKQDLVLFVMLDALQVPFLQPPHWFLGAYTHVGD